MRPMWRDGLEKARMGFTTLDEVRRALAIGAFSDAADLPTQRSRAA